MQPIELKGILDGIKPISPLRFIVLTLKNDVDNSINIQSLNYTKSFCNRNICNELFLSKHLSLPFDSPLFSFSKNIMNKLTTSPIDSLDGISVVTERPMNNPIMLNTIRPAVMRKYYGLSRGTETNGRIKRATYGYCNGQNSLGTDPAKYITKPFDSDMIGMSLCLQSYLKQNIDAFNFNDLDLSRIFNSCTVLIYNCGDEIKKDANMGWHTDVKYKNNGIFSKNILTHKWRIHLQ